MVKIWGPQKWPKLDYRKVVKIVKVHFHNTACISQMATVAFIAYCKSGNFGQCNIFGKRKNTPFGKKKFSVLRTLDY